MRGRIETILLAAIAVATLGGCKSAVTAFGHFPGEDCDDHASVKMILANYESYREAMAKRTPPVAKPALVAVENPSEIPVDPQAPGGNRRYCAGTAIFDDGTRQPVYSSWLRGWEPNLVSGPGFRWCMGEPDPRCAGAAPPALTGG